MFGLNNIILDKILLKWLSKKVLPGPKELLFGPENNSSFSCNSLLLKNIEWINRKPVIIKNTRIYTVGGKGFLQSHEIIICATKHYGYDHFTSGRRSGLVTWRQSSLY